MHFREGTICPSPLRIKMVISYPVPPYSNVAIQAQFYQPSRFVISDITLGQTTIVETSEEHNYVIGQEIRLLIPATFGCTQLNNQTGFVLSIPTTDSVEISIYSLGGNVFISATATIQSPQIIAIGDINVGDINANGRTNQATDVPGSFINISPS